MTGRREDLGPGKKANPRQEEPQPGTPERLQRSANWAGIVSAFLGAVALLLAYLALHQGGGDAVPTADPRHSQLETVDLIAKNGPPPHEPALELIVKNSGGTSVITRARIEVRRVFLLPLCFTQGSLPVSERYGVRLPPDAEPGELIEVPLHQQVGTNRADRFAIRLGIDTNRAAPVGAAAEELGMKAGDGQLPGLYLFEVGVSLVHDGGVEPLEMGTALVALPELPLGPEYLLEEGGFKQVTDTFLTEDPQATWREPMACWRANAQIAARARESGATRSPELEKVLSAAVIPRWSEAEG